MRKVVNEARLFGNLVSDPEAKEIKTGWVVNFRMVTTEIFVDSSGAERTSKEYHSIAVFRNLAKTVIAWNLLKGNEVTVTGRLRTRSWNKDGVKHYRTEVVARTIERVNSNENISAGDVGRQGSETQPTA